MTEGELQASKIEAKAKRIKLFALPLAVCASVASFFLIVPKISFCVLVFILLISFAFDDYRKLNKILKSPIKLNELKSIETKRKAAVFVNGGFIRELKHMLLIAVAVAHGPKRPPIKATTNANPGYQRSKPAAVEITPHSAPSADWYNRDE